MKTQKGTAEKVLKLLSVNDYKNIVVEIENLMERWHLGRDNDAETLNDINDVLYKNGYLTFFNDKQNKISKTKYIK